MNTEIETPEKAGMNSRVLDLIGPAMQSYVDRKLISGISTMISRKGRIVHFGQVGLMDIDARRPMSADALFRIYSMTKPVICAALMTLYDKGLFDLSDPVARFIPAFGRLKVLVGGPDGKSVLADPVRAVTIRDLMTHTSGLTYDFLEDSPVGELYRQARIMNDAERPLEKMIGELVRLPLAWQPGSRWHYSVGIDVAAYLVEVISGLPLGEFLDKTLFGPLGMIDTGFGVPAAKQHRVAQMYGLPDVFGRDMTFGILPEAEKKGFLGKVDVSLTNPLSAPGGFARGGYGLFTSAPDYMRFARMLLGGGELDGTRILADKTATLMHTNQVPAALLPYRVSDPPAYGYGFGLGSKVLLDVAETGKPGSIGEFGWGGAAKTAWWADPREQMVCILMTQSMLQPHLPDADLRVLAYRALENK